MKYREYKEEQARAARQRELDRLEHGVRLNCKNAIESTIAEKFDGFILPRNTADGFRHSGVEAETDEGEPYKPEIPSGG